MLLTGAGPKCEWHATPVPGDVTRSLVVVSWDNANYEDDFEASANVLALGDPWNQLPANALPLLASFSDGPAQATANAPAVASPDTPAIPIPSDTVSAALKKIAWPGARMVGR